jgi:hypothetical protein
MINLDLAVGALAVTLVSLLQDAYHFPMALILVEALEYQHISTD